MDTRSAARHEQLGFLTVGVFVGFAAVRDVYFARALQAASPLLVAAIAFSLCTLVFAGVSVGTRPGQLSLLRRWPGELLAVNVTSAVAWIAFLYALARLEPALMQIVWAGIGPTTIRGLERCGVALARPAALGPGERLGQAGILASIALATSVVLLGRSATGPQDPATTLAGIALALTSGVAITVNTLLCKRLNERGVPPETLVSVRFVGVVVAAPPLALMTGVPSATWSMDAVGAVAVPALLLIVLPVYVNQLGIALASPLTVRVVHALGPVVVFGLQRVDGRLPPSPWSLAAIALYSLSAMLAAAARHAAAVARPAR